MPAQPAARSLVRFGVFQLDLASGELHRGGLRVRLQELPFRALTLLLSRPGQVVTHEDFRRELWPADVFVDFDRALRSAIKRLRDALGDDPANPIFIETLERRGYRFIAPVQVVEPDAGAEARLPGLADSTETGNTPPGEPAIPDAPPPTRPQAPARSRGRWLRLATAAAVMALATAAAWRVAHLNSPASAQASVPPRHVPSQAAHDLYLNGRFYWNKRTAESLHEAVTLFQQAIEHDPAYADAYSGLADCYLLLREYSTMSSNEAFLQALLAARKAAELDPASSDAHASLGFINFWGMWDLDGSDREFRRAIELDSHNVKALHWYATFLYAIGREEEALTRIEQARTLDPNSRAILADKGEILRSAGHPEQAVQLLKQLERAEPDFMSAHRYLWHLYFDLGDGPNYVAEFREEARITHNAQFAAQADAAERGWKRGGLQGMKQAQFEVEVAQYKRHEISPCWVARMAASAGRNDALQYARECVRAHEEGVWMLVGDPVWRPYRSQPEYQNLTQELSPLRRPG